MTNFKSFLRTLRKEIEAKLPSFVSFAQRVFHYLHILFQFCRNYLESFNRSFPRTTQKIQLCFIFFFALVDLLFSVLNNVFAFGYFPSLLMPIFPLIESILLSPFFSFWASPEKVFLMSFLVIEFMIVRSLFKLSKLVKYYILLIFSLLMIQGLTVSYWDLIFNREITHDMAKWALDRGIVIYTDKMLASVFFFNTFLIFIGLYSYLFFYAIQGKFATIPGCYWLTDSIAFWLRIKTPTMRFGSGTKTSSQTNKEKDQDQDDDDDLFLDLDEDQTLPTQDNDSQNS